MEHKEFSNYFTSVILKEMLKTPDMDVTTIKVDLKLSTLKPLHVETLRKVCEFFKTENGKNVIRSGFRFTGINSVVCDARNGPLKGLDPFV